MSTAVHYSFLNHRLISHPALPYSFFLISRFRYSPLICLPTYAAVFPSNYVSLWFVPLSLYSDRELLFNGPLVYTTLSCFILLLSIRLLNFTCPLAHTSFLLFSLGIFSQPIGPYLSGLILFRLFFYLSIGLYPFVLVSFRLRFTFSLDRTAFSFFFSLFMFPLYHLLLNCQYILPYLFLNFQKIQTVFQSSPECLPYPVIIRNPPASYVPAHTQKAFSCHPENFILY